MKTKDYINKHKLNLGDKFNHNEFISDLTFDFMTLMEVGKAHKNIKGFENAVRAIRMKWDAINNKTLGILPVKLWNYFYATVIAKTKEKLFPEILAERKRKSDEYKKRKEAYKRYNDSFYDDMFFFSMINSFFRNQKPLSSFALLELNTDASIEDIKKQYRKLSMIHHPDKGGNRNKFEEITEAKNKCLSFLNQTS